MDRNLGALDDKYHDKANIKSKYYQWGRKDPFNSDIFCWTYDAQTLAPTKTSFANGARTSKQKTDLENEFSTDGHNVPFSVTHPTTYISNNGGEWSSITDIFGGMKLDDNMTTKYWNDPFPFNGADNEETLGKNENKSFFDPCPLGWRLPVQGWVKGFRGDSNGPATGDATLNCQWGVELEFRGRGENGRTYVPLGYYSQKGNRDTPTAFFPASGYIHTGRMADVGSYGEHWSSTPITNGVGDHFAVYRGAVNPSANYFLRSIGCSVRCLRE